MSTELAAAEHMALNEPGTDVASKYNVDPKGWALVESYIWDIGEDEEIERLIDKALRILLIHPEFEKLIWKNRETIDKLYHDDTFGEVVSQIHGILLKITQEMVAAQISTVTAFSALTDTIRNVNFQEMYNHMAAKSDLAETEIDANIDPEEEVKLAQMGTDEMFGIKDKPDDEDRASKYAFWNVTVYKQLKDSFGLNNKARESYLWSFLLSIACCIKYLEIEINAMPQFDIEFSNRGHEEKKQVIWDGFIVPPTHGTVGVNKLKDEEKEVELKTELTHYVQLRINRQTTELVRGDPSHCAGCFVQLQELNWTKDNEPYCEQCIKFRVYQECVRKFVLEYDNEETRDDLWPWYENSKNQMDRSEYKAILDMYTDQVLQIGSILDSNLKYYVPRAQTLAIAKHGSNQLSHDSVRDIDMASDEGAQIKNLLTKSRTKFQPYRNIRYLRKFAAMFLLGEREIWKDLLKLKKHLKDKRSGFRSTSVANDTIPEHKPRLSNKLSQDKSAIDDDTDFRISTDDRLNLRALLKEPEVRALLYNKTEDDENKHGHDEDETVDLYGLQQKILYRHIQFTKVEIKETLEPLHDADDGFARAESKFVANMNQSRPGIEKFLTIWSRLPAWWEPIHDEILLELALRYQLDVEQYNEALDDEEYYQSVLEDHFYKAFEFWCTKSVNVQHRLRFLLYIIDQRMYPDSMIFMNEIMKNSHFMSFALKVASPSAQSPSESLKAPSMSRNQSCLIEFGVEDKPVRNIEREFRDIVQLLEPEALGVRIWRFIMNQMAAKQRKSLWAALTILAEELPSNMVLSLLEEDREILRRGKARYVNAVCQAVIKGSNYPTATALHLARYMEENADTDLARTEIWSEFSDEYEEIAIHLINMVESDHLLAMLLEIPTDIQQKTIIEMAVLYRRVRFVNSARVQGVMTHMWSESEFLNPNKPIRTTYLDLHEQFKLLWKSPVRYYYCPLGLYATTALLYISYLFLVSYISYTQIYPYEEYVIFSLETLMWFCNAGYIIYEGLEFEQKRAQYFAMDSMINVLDTWISINWVLLFLMRITAGGFAPDVEDIDDGSYIDYIGPQQLDPTIIRQLVLNGTDTELSLLDRSDPLKRNERYTIVYMAIWGTQIIILWIRCVGLLQRTEIMGPLLTMLIRVMQDVTSFLILVFAITIGFLFAVHYIVGGDIDRDVTCDLSSIYEDDIDACVEVSQALNSIRGIGLYLVQSLLGQQDWSVMDANPLYGFDRGRAQLLTLIVLAYILLGTIISLNMLIAIMTTSFETLNDEAQQQLAFLRVETTYDLAHRGRMMPPPVNVFVVGIWLLITVINWLIKMLSCGKCKLNLDGINPYYIACLRRGSQYGKSSIIRRENEAAQTSRNWSASTEKKKLQKEIERMQTEAQDKDSIDMNEPRHKKKASLGAFAGWEAMFESIDSLADDSKRRYCKYCYCRMKDTKEGKVDNYFKFFAFGSDASKKASGNKGGFGLDKDDMRMIQRLFRYCSLCPQCFRPFGIWTISKKGKNTKGSSDESLGDKGTDRYDRHHVLMDVISCYLFLLLVWILLIIILAIPAFFSHCFARVAKSEQTGYASNKQLDAGAFGDYHRGVEQQTVKTIVDKKYGGAEAFDDDGSDEDDDGTSAYDAGGKRRGAEFGADSDKIQKLLFDIGEKVNMIHDPTYKEKSEQKAKKKTTMQLEKQQRRKTKMLKKKKAAAKRRKQSDAMPVTDDDEDIVEPDMFSGALENITSKKNIIQDVEEEEEVPIISEPKKVAFKQEDQQQDNDDDEDDVP